MDYIIGISLALVIVASISYLRKRLRHAAVNTTNRGKIKKYTDILSLYLQSGLPG
jgi:hypothetical protein